MCAKQKRKLSIPPHRVHAEKYKFSSKVRSPLQSLLLHPIYSRHSSGSFCVVPWKAINFGNRHSLSWRISLCPCKTDRLSQIDRLAMQCEWVAGWRPLSRFSVFRRVCAVVFGLHCARKSSTAKWKERCILASAVIISHVLFDHSVFGHACRDFLSSRPKNGTKPAIGSGRWLNSD